MKAALRVVLALFFVGAGVNHFIVTDFYLRMMPTYPPLHPDAFPQFGATALWLRLPIQAVLIAWAFWYTGKNRRERGDR